MKTYFFLILACLGMAVGAQAQPGDTLEWLPVGTEWVYQLNDLVGDSSHLRYRVEKDTLYRGRTAKLIRHTTDSKRSAIVVLLSRSGPQGDSIWIAENASSYPRNQPGDWRFYFRTSAHVGDTIMLKAYDYGFGEHRPLVYRVEAVTDTLIGAFRLPYLQLEFMLGENRLTGHCPYYGPDSAN